MVLHCYSSFSLCKEVGIIILNIKVLIQNKSQGM
jgi:hypothetical protein